MQNLKTSTAPINTGNPLEPLHSAVTALGLAIHELDTQIDAANHNYMENAEILGDQAQSNELYRNYILTMAQTGKLAHTLTNLGLMTGTVQPREGWELVQRTPEPQQAQPYHPSVPVRLDGTVETGGQV